jgi:hypothetical protein
MSIGGVVNVGPSFPSLASVKSLRLRDPWGASRSCSQIIEATKRRSFLQKATKVTKEKLSMSIGGVVSVGPSFPSLAL